MPKTDGYPAHVLIEALAAAKRCSRRAKEPYHVIDRDGALHVVKTICDSDHVVARDVTCARYTGAMISAECESMQEINSALPYIRRAAEIIRAKGFKDGPEADEIVAYLLEQACDRAGLGTPDRGDMPASVRYERPVSTFARLFGRAVYG